MHQYRPRSPQRGPFGELFIVSCIFCLIILADYLHFYSGTYCNYHRGAYLLNLRRFNTVQRANWRSHE